MNWDHACKSLSNSSIELDFQLTLTEFCYHARCTFGAMTAMSLDFDEGNTPKIPGFSENRHNFV